MTIRDIAKLAGVSVSTVSKVMNIKDSSISQETREKVLRIVKEYNYSPYASIITPRTKTFQIGVLFRGMDNSQTTLAGIMAEAGRHGYTLSIASYSEDRDDELKAITAFCKNKVDALLWEKSPQAPDACTEQLEDADIPFFVFNSPEPGAENIDYSSIGYQAVQTLIDRGHTDIACILANGTRTPGFFEGYRKCLFDHQLPFRGELVFHEASPNLLYKISSHSVSAIVCSHFSETLKLYGKCSDLHCQIPEDVSLISLKDDARPSTNYPMVSTYTIPHCLFGSYLCRKTILHIEQDAPSSEAFEPEIRIDNLSTVDIPFLHRSKKITVIGSINIDNYLNVPELPVSGKSVRTSVSSLYPGGKATNEAVGAAKLGHHVSLLGNVGGDTDSALIYDALRDYSIDTSALMSCPGQLTGRAYIIVDSRGDSLISILSGASGRLRPEDVRNRERVFRNTGYTLINTEISMDTVAEACILTHQHGGQTIVKPSSCGHIPEKVLRDIDILVPNQSELEEIAPTGETLSEKADYFLRQGVRIVIVTLGAEGCFLKTGTQEKYYPAMDFAAIDNTGAGDAFIAALSSYLLYGYDLDRSIRIAGYAAGFSITREGVVPALIDRNTLESYIRQKEPELLE